MRALAQRLLAVACLLSCFAASAAGAADAEDPLAEVAAQLRSAPILRGDFDQERRLRVLDRPIASRGSFIFVSGEGVLWHVRDPQEATLLIRADEIIDWSGQKEPRRVDAAANPAFNLLAETLLDVLGGDLSALSDRFDVQALPAETGWKLELLPAEEEVSAMVERIEIAGAEFVEEVHILEAKGDATKLRFLDLKTAPEKLSDDERTYFEE